MRAQVPSTPAGRRLRRRGLIVLVGLAAVAALAIAVPVAWATFGDVPPANPFYADVNAIQGAGITQGCGGGNFCPGDSIQRQAEAAFVHRAAGRAGVGFAGPLTVPPSPSSVDLGDLTMSIGGVPGQTQFVLLIAEVDLLISSLTGCPCRTDFAIYSDQFGGLVSGVNMNDSLPAAGGAESDGAQSALVQGVFPVPSGTTQTFHLYASLRGGTGTVTGFGTLSAITAPFGPTGGNTLGVQVNALAHRKGLTLVSPPK